MNEMLQRLCTRLGYKHNYNEDGYGLLTFTRYTQIKEIDAMYVKDDLGRIYKVTCEEVNFKSLPEAEKEVYVEMLQQERIGLYESGILTEK